MKTFLDRFRIGKSLDSESVPPSLRRRIEREPELHDMEELFRGMCDELEAAPASAPPPEDLHHRIMQSINRADRAGLQRPFHTPMHLWRWLPLPAAALLVLTIAWIAYRQAGFSSTAKAQNPDFLAAAADLSKQSSAFFPPLLTPLSDEMARLEQDLDQTTRFLLASVP